ncbi:hypothetical protein GP486_002917 [Trichoglossum hirsutum]|uniref:Uncharacterized protein n=1 Tax=Trichoglossum hirsutum TaxID=265104 RepID=A0A9P8RRA1_9PEZI|nr:hypothetical protein GP486_002917 [Trichoglossum hirsutum]
MSSPLGAGSANTASEFPRVISEEPTGPVGGISMPSSSSSFNSSQTPTPSTTLELPTPGSFESPVGALPRPTAPSVKPSSQKPVGAIAGGVIGGVAGLVLIVLAFLLLRRRKLSKESVDDYGKSRSELTYRTTDMSSDSYSGAYPSRYGQLPKAYEVTPTGHSNPNYSLPTVVQEQSNYTDQHNASREAANATRLPTRIHPQDQAAPPASPTRNELDSREVNEDGVSVRSPSPDIDMDARLDSIRGPTPTPESQAVRSQVPRLPLISRTRGDQGPTI